MNKFLKIYLDDERSAPFTWIRARTPREVIWYLARGLVAEISLDHDLGDDENIGTGYDVLSWIEEAVVCDGFVPPKITIHTANPAARTRMEAAVKQIYALSLYVE